MPMPTDWEPCPGKTNAIVMILSLFRCVSAVHNQGNRANQRFITMPIELKYADGLYELPEGQLIYHAGNTPELNPLAYREAATMAAILKKPVILLHSRHVHQFDEKGTLAKALLTAADLQGLVGAHNALKLRRFDETHDFPGSAPALRPPAKQPSRAAESENARLERIRMEKGQSVLAQFSWDTPERGGKRTGIRRNLSPDERNQLQFFLEQAHIPYKLQMHSTVSLSIGETDYQTHVRPLLSRRKPPSR
jgi:hypothetical protein